MKVAGLISGFCFTFVLALAAGSSLADTPQNPCAGLPLAPDRLVKNAVFPADLAPFGHVCFAAHLAAAPASPAGPGRADALPVIAFSLFQAGRKLYDFPGSDDWAPAVDSIVSVAFRKLNGDQFTDVIIIGHEDGHFGDIYVPLVYRGDPQGFTADTDLTDNLPGAYATMPALLRAIAQTRTRH